MAYAPKTNALPVFDELSTRIERIKRILTDELDADKVYSHRKDIKR